MMEQMSNWLIGSILFSLGSLVLVFGLVLINNLLHKFWKPVTVVYMRNESVYPRIRFATPEDNVKDPEFEQLKEVDNPKN